MPISPDAVISACSGLGGILVGSGIVVAVVKSKFVQVEKLSQDLETLKGQRVGSLENRMEAFERGCVARHDRIQEGLGKVERMAADISNMIGWTKKNDAKLDRLGEDTASVRAHVEAQDKWLSNLDHAHQTHVGDRGIHHA